MGCGSPDYVFNQILSTLYIKQIQSVTQKAPISFIIKKKNAGLIKFSTSKGNKVRNDCKLASFFDALSLGKAVFY